MIERKLRAFNHTFEPLIMKYLFFVILSSFSVLAFAQNKKQNRLLQEGEFVVHGYADFGAGVSIARDQLMINGDLSANAVLNQTYVLGYFLTGNLNNLTYPVTYRINYGINGDFITTTDDGNFNLLLSGVQAGYIYQSNFPFHAAGFLRVGWGNSKLYDPFERKLQTASVSMIEPRVEGYYRFNAWCKAKVALSYRFITNYNGDSAYDLSTSTFQSPHFQVGFQFGWFDLK